MLHKRIVGDGNVAQGWEGLYVPLGLSVGNFCFSNQEVRAFVSRLIPQLERPKGTSHPAKKRENVEKLLLPERAARKALHEMLSRQFAQELRRLRFWKSPSSFSIFHKLHCPMHIYIPALISTFSFPPRSLSPSVGLNCPYLSERSGNTRGVSGKEISRIRSFGFLSETRP